MAILEALQRWEDKLLGYPIHIVTDHKALEFFRQQPTLSGRQTCWAEYLDRLQWEITYIEGPHNKVADTLSRYYQNDTWYDTHVSSEYVTAHIHLDKDLDNIPLVCREEILKNTIEVHALKVVDMLEQRRSTRLLDKREARDLEAAHITAGMHANSPDNEIVVDDPSNDPTVMEPRARNQDLHKLVFDNHSELLKAVRDGYKQDPLYSKILDDPDSYKAFKVKDKLLWVHNHIRERVLCVP